jgi:fucose 4-O-acetylase-like acetyltransferase
MILLVVVGHAWRGLTSDGIVPAHHFEAVDSRIYAFHMPAFFALSGWFFLASLESRTPKDFYRGRVLRLFWPMVIWTYIFLGTKAMAGQYANSPIGWEDVFVVPIPGVMHLWFLWALLVLSLGFSALKLFSSGGRIPDGALWGATVVVVAIQFVPLSDFGIHWIGSAVRHAPFFVLGMICGRVLELHRTPVILRYLAALALVAILAALPVLDGVASAPVIAMLLTVCVLVVFSGFGPTAGNWPGRILVAMGVASMPIFLAHTIFSASLREALLLAEVDDLLTHMLLGTVVGIGGPMILWHVANRLRLVRVLGF